MLRVGLTGGIGAGKSAVAAAAGRARRGRHRRRRGWPARSSRPAPPGLAEVVAGVRPRGARARRRAGPAGAGPRSSSPTTARRAELEGDHPSAGRGRGRRELIAAAPADAVVVHDVPLLVESRAGRRASTWSSVVGRAAGDRAGPSRLAARIARRHRRAAARGGRRIASAGQPRGAAGQVAAIVVDNAARSAETRPPRVGESCGTECCAALAARS